MADLHQEASALSDEIDAHLRGRAASTWPGRDTEAVEDDDALTG